MNEPRSLAESALRTAELRAQARLRSSVRSLLGQQPAQTTAASARAQVLAPIRRHPLLAAALSTGAGFVLASTWRRGAGATARRGGQAFGFAARHLLVLSQIVSALRASPSKPAEGLDQPDVAPGGDAFPDDAFPELGT